MHDLIICPQCGDKLIDEVIYTYPLIYIKRCFNCGWKREGLSKIKYVKFEDTISDCKIKLKNRNDLED